MHLSYHLADVQLHCNHLVALDPSLFAATSITSLRLDSNLITNLPDDVASASSLQVTLSSCVSNKILYCSGHHSRLNLTPVAPAAGAEHFIQPVAAAAYSSVRPHLIANPDVPRLPLGFIHLAPKGKFRLRVAVHWAPILVTVYQTIVKRGAASKRCGCDPPPPEVAGLAPLHDLMDIFRRMCVDHHEHRWLMSARGV